MKKVISILMTTFLLLMFAPSQLIAVEDSDNLAVSTVNTVETAKVEALTVRLNEIKAMDIPALNSAEKKELRKEVRSIKGELKQLAKAIQTRLQTQTRLQSAKQMSAEMEFTFQQEP